MYLCSCMCNIHVCFVLLLFSSSNTRPSWALFIQWNWLVDVCNTMYLYLYLYLFVVCVCVCFRSFVRLVCSYWNHRMCGLELLFHSICVRARFCFSLASSLCPWIDVLFQLFQSRFDALFSIVNTLTHSILYGRTQGAGDRAPAYQQAENLAWLHPPPPRRNPAYALDSIQLSSLILYCIAYFLYNLISFSVPILLLLIITDLFRIP